MNRMNRWPGATGFLLLAACAAPADVRELHFANVGQSYSAFQPADDPATGRPITLTRIYLYLSVEPGADAADFSTDLLLPTEPDEGNTNVVFFTGPQLEWSGSGTFTHIEETTRFNGTIIARRFGAETLPMNAVILEGSRIELEYTPAGRPTDLDGDGQVGLSDLALLLSDFGCSEPPCIGDVDADGDTDISDLSQLLADFGL